MSSPERTKERLEKGFRVLETILLRRLLEDSPRLGLGIERNIVDRELRELEEDLRRNPPVLPRSGTRRGSLFKR